MLSEVLFLMDKENEDNATLIAALEDEAGYIRQCGYGADISFAEKEISDKYGTLVVTDSPLMAGRMHDTGCNVVGMLHDANRGAEFPRAKYVFGDIDQVDMDSFVKAYQRCVGEPWDVLETERLKVRETTVEDVDEFYRIYADPSMTLYMEGLFEDPKDEKKYQKDYIDKVYALMGFGVWTVIRKEDDTIIGRAGYSVRNGFDEIELGFLIGCDYQRQGYCMEVCRAILDYGRDMLQFDRVMTLVKAENLVSIHICEKLGFKKTEEVNVEENIYGETYNQGQKVALGQEKYGKYVKLVLEF